MATAHKPKAADKQTICRKLTLALRKRYPEKLPKPHPTVLDTLLYAVCLDNATVQQADAAFERLHTEFHDLNEVRVSSITELAGVFREMEMPDWRALATRSILQYVFEKTFSFDLESLRRKTLEAATKTLSKISHLSPFVRDYTLYNVLGSHAVPLDEAMLRAAVWLGLADPGHTPEQASEALKPVLRKADAPTFCHYLRCLANDPRLKPVFAQAASSAPADGYDMLTALERLGALLAEADARKPAAGRSRKGKDGGSKKPSATKPGVSRSAPRRSSDKNPPPR